MKKMSLFFVVIFLINPAFNALSAETVIMNTKTLIYHSADCKWAKKCTKNCVKTDKKKALDQGARACKICGG